MKDIKNELLEEDLQDPEFAEAWRKSSQRRALSMQLVAMRKASGLTQRKLADLAGWKQPYVARLESATGDFPSFETLARYADVCGHNVALVFGESANGTMNVDAGIEVSATRRSIGIKSGELIESPEDLAAFKGS